MRVIALLAAPVLALALQAGIAAAGPKPGNGPWVFCPNNSPTCAAQLGPDLDPADEDFDCLTRSGQPGIGLQNLNNQRAGCWS
jgi:hypothetical protein